MENMCDCFHFHFWAALSSWVVLSSYQLEDTVWLSTSCLEKKFLKERVCVLGQGIMYNFFNLGFFFFFFFLFLFLFSLSSVL